VLDAIKEGKRPTELKHHLERVGGVPIVLDGFGGYVEDPSAFYDATAELEAWAEPDLNPAKRKALTEALEADGYPAGQVPPSRAGIATLKAENVFIPDETFHRLLSLTGGPSELVVADIDQGMNLKNMVLARHARPGSAKNFADGSDQLIDTTGHGTHTSSLLTAGADELRTVNCQLSDDFLKEGNTKLLEAIRHALDQGAKVINMSLGVSPNGIEELVQLIDEHSDVSFVFAAGNQPERIDQPQADGRCQSNWWIAKQQLPNVAIVAAAGRDGGLWQEPDILRADMGYVPLRGSGTTVGAPYVTHAALGEKVISASSFGGYSYSSGTSFSAPIYANAVAKVRMVGSRLSPVDANRVLAMTSDPDARWTTRVDAGGTINRERALNLAAIIQLASHASKIDEAMDTIGVTGVERVRLPTLARAFLTEPTFTAASH
jgi:subtilisin family serine protease